MDTRRLSSSVDVRGEACAGVVAAHAERVGDLRQSRVPDRLAVAGADAPRMVRSVVSTPGPRSPRSWDDGVIGEPRVPAGRQVAPDETPAVARWVSEERQ